MLGCHPSTVKLYVCVSNLHQHLQQQFWQWDPEVGSIADGLGHQPSCCPHETAIRLCVSKSQVHEVLPGGPAVGEWSSVFPWVPPCGGSTSISKVDPAVCGSRLVCEESRIAMHSIHMKPASTSKQQQNMRCSLPFPVRHPPSCAA